MRIDLNQIWASFLTGIPMGIGIAIGMKIWAWVAAIIR